MNHRSKTVLLTGGTGLIGSVITDQLVKDGHQVLIVSRSKKEDQKNVKFVQWDLDSSSIELEPLKQVQVVIHLAGASVAKRWTSSYKQEIIDSRVKTASLLYESFLSLDHQFEAYIGASASGFYPQNSGIIHTEKDVIGNDFLSKVCEEWEAAHHQFSQIADRVVIHRIGVVLANNGGALEPMVQPIKFGLAPYFGNGQHFYPWVHLQDVAAQFVYSVNHDLAGIFNANTGNITQKELNESIANALHKKVIPFPSPVFALKLAMGEMHEIVTDSYQMSADKIRQLGFSPTFTTIDSALQNLFT